MTDTLPTRAPLSPPPPPSPQQQLARGLVLRDGTTLGVFPRARHGADVLVLEPHGHAFTAIDPRGRMTRHLSPTALGAHRPLLRAVLDLRNRHGPCADHVMGPYVHRRLLGPQEMSPRPRRRPRTASATPAVLVQWPTPTATTTTTRMGDDADDDLLGLWCPERGVFELRSLEGSARVWLDASARVVGVRFHVPVPRDPDDPDTGGDDDATVAAQEQLFPTPCTPPWLRYPVTRLLDARRRWLEATASARGAGTAPVDWDPVPQWHAATTTTTRVHAAPNAAWAPRPSFRPLFATTQAADAADDTDPAMPMAIEELVRMLQSPAQSWRLLREIVVDVHDGATFFVCAGGPDDPEAVDDVTPRVLVLSRDAARTGDTAPSPVVEFQRGFFTVSELDVGGECQQPPQPRLQQFPIDAVPVRLELLASDFEHLRRLVDHTNCLWQAALMRPPRPPRSRVLGQSTMTRASAFPIDAPADPLPPSTDTDVNTQRDDLASSNTCAGTSSGVAASAMIESRNDHGRFRFFPADGRVHVAFADRTLLQLRGVECSVLDRAGRRTVCTVDSASPWVWAYLRPALEFEEWARATPIERFERHLARQRQQVLVDRELQRIAVQSQLNGLGTDDW